MNKIYISGNNAKIYYEELLNLDDYQTNYLYNKVPILKNIMEYEILKEITNINHFKNPYETGQLKWLKDNIEKMDKNGSIINGFIPKQIITGIEHLFAERNVAEHQQKMNDAVYRGLFNTVAETINFFSKIDIPEGIKNICSNNKQTKGREKIVARKKNSNNVDDEIKKIEKRVPKWLRNKEQYNSKILYAFIKLYKQNNGIVTLEKLKEEAGIKGVGKFEKNYDQMKNFGPKNHGKIFEQNGEKVYLWNKIEDIIWNQYKQIKKL